MPLNTFGLIPIIAALVILDKGQHIAIPLVISNTLFNMTSSFMDVGFLWSQAPGRIVVAVFAGTIAGVILTKTSLRNKNIVRLPLLSKLADAEDTPMNLGTAISNSLYLIGPFIIIGSFGYTLLSNHLMEWLKTLIYGSSFGLNFVKTSARLNLFNNVFMIALSIFTTLINPLFICASLFIFKIKGIIRIYIYYGLIFILLSCSLFIK
ncbi:MAG: hypothetical protein Q8936_12320 [Bacillota bacterium]|nr:hypothetical protein [Bacillota bacterium]